MDGRDGYNIILAFSSKSVKITNWSIINTYGVTVSDQVFVIWKTLIVLKKITIEFIWL